MFILDIHLLVLFVSLSFASACAYGFYRLLSSHIEVFIAGQIVGLYAGYSVWGGLIDDLKGVMDESPWLYRMIKSAYDFHDAFGSTAPTVTIWLSTLVALSTATLVYVGWYLFLHESGDIVKRGDDIQSDNAINQASKKDDGELFLIGKIRVPRLKETLSWLISGEPGVGKTILIRMILEVARRRKNRCVVVDPGFDLYRNVGLSPGDKVLTTDGKNPMDWSPFAEISSKTLDKDCLAMAAATIPEGIGESVEWNAKARMLCADLLKGVIQKHEATNRQLVWHVSEAPISELKQLIDGMASSRMFEQGSEKMLSNVLAILSKYTSVWRELSPEGNAQSTSIRQWVKEDSDGGFLWLPFKDFGAEASQPLRQTLLNLIISSSMELKESRDRRLLVILDELVSNGQLNGLSQAVARGRKYGMSLIMAVQSQCQIESVYGDKEAKSIVSSCGNKVIFRTPEPDTADYLSRCIGDLEIDKHRKSTSSPGGVTEQYVSETKRVVSPSQIISLPDFEGYVKIAGVGWGEFKLKMPVKNKDDKTDERSRKKSSSKPNGKAGKRAIKPKSSSKGQRTKKANSTIVSKAGSTDLNDVVEVNRG